MRQHIHAPGCLRNAQVFSVLVIVVLTAIAAKGLNINLPWTAEQRAKEVASLEEQQARWAEQRQARQQKAPFDLALYVLRNLGVLVIVLGAGAGVVIVATVYGLRRAITIYPRNGQHPLFLGRLGGAWKIYDPNKQITAGANLSDDTAILPAPGWEGVQVAALAGTPRVALEAARAAPERLTVNNKGDGGAVLPADGSAQAVAMDWPNRVPLTRYLDVQGGADLGKIFLGVTCDPATGQQARVTMGMDELVHFAVAGSSGFGKTTFVESLLYQFVKSQACDLAIVDLKGELTPWGRADALRWPIATTRSDGGAILTACYEELQARKEAFENLGGCKSLADYNARANGNALRPLCAVLDEGTVLLRGDKELTDQATDLVLLGRSFGLWLVLAAQNFKVSSTASEVRDQLTTRVQFHAADGNQARILLGHDRATGLSKGRAIARLSGYGSDIELQAPVVTRQEIDALLIGQHGPRNPAPVVVDVTPATPVNSITTEQRQRIVELADAGEKPTSIVMEIWGSKNGRRARQVREIIDKDLAARQVTR